jgi:uncharacterized protein YlxP (DUF503 family)
MAVVVGVGRWVLHLPGCTSLKAKRRIVRSLRDRLQSRFRVSAAETDFQDKWQKAEICVAVVASDRAVADALLGRLDEHVGSDPRAHVIEREIVLY